MEMNEQDRKHYISIHRLRDASYTDETWNDLMGEHYYSLQRLHEVSEELSSVRKECIKNGVHENHINFLNEVLLISILKVDERTEFLEKNIKIYKEKIK